MSEVTRWEAPVSDRVLDEMILQTDPSHLTSVRIGNAAYSMTGHGPVQVADHVSVNMADMAPKGGDILSTARNAMGSPTGRLDANTTVELVPGVPSSRTSLQAAERLGYIRRSSHGTWEVTNRPKADAPNSSASQQNAQLIKELSEGRQDGEEFGDEPEEPFELFSEADEGLYGDMIADIPQPLYDRAVVMGALAAVDSGDVESITAQVSQMMGAPQIHAEKMLQAGAMLFSRQAAKALEGLGADPEEFYTWAREHRREALKQAAISQVSIRSLDGYRQLVDDYFRNNEPSIAVIKAHGLDAFHDKNTGKDMVLLHGQWMTVTNATKAGYL